MSYNQLIEETTDALLNEDVHDYLRKLAKKGIKKIGTGDFKSVLAKYGDKKEKEIFATQDYSGKSLDLKSLFGGLSKGIGERVAKERAAHPYKIELADNWDTNFPKAIGYVSPNSADKIRNPEEQRDILRRLYHREEKETNRVYDSPVGRESEDLFNRKADIEARLDQHDAKMQDVRQFVTSNARAKLRGVSRVFDERYHQNIRPLEKAEAEADRKYNAALNAWDTEENLRLKKDNPAEHDRQFSAMQKKALADYKIHDDALTSARAVHYRERAQELVPLQNALEAAEVKAKGHAKAYYEKHAAPLHKEYAELDARHALVANEVIDKTSDISKKYYKLRQAAASVTGSTPLDFSNYTEHVAQSELPRPTTDRKGRRYGGGHWGGFKGTTEFNVITSDLDHPTLGKTLFVHEIQSDLQQKTKNDSPIGKTWHEHALTHIKNGATEHGYEHVMFAPPSVQYVNNGGHATAGDVQTALGRATAEQRQEIHDDAGTLDHEALSSVLRNGAGDLAKRYHEQIFPTANKVFGHEPELHTMGYKRGRGTGNEELHHFPVYKVEKNIAAMEESFQAYMKNKTLVENVTNKLLGAE